MKRFFTLLLGLAAMFIQLKDIHAQTNIPIPNGNFEAWSNGNGYSVTALIVTLPVFDSYTYPSNWNYPLYPVNQTITYIVSVNINTNLPLLKVSRETNSVAEGNSALKMETFMLSDIINPTVYNLAQSSIAPEYANMVFPTILSTGVLDLDQMLPFMYSITNNMGSIAQLMSTFIDEDINDYVDGGLALNGLVPGRITGQYKYTSASTGNDNGGILMLGTKFNNNTHRREVVGGGYTTALTNTSTYTPFEVIYRPLGDIFSTQPMIEPDSLLIFLFSSANNHRQQGSVLYLDNLQLWAAEPEIPVEEDTCNAVTNLIVDYVDTTLASLSWLVDDTPDHWEAEYGTQGFTQGSGNLMTTANNSIILSELQPDTYYDVYVRSVCDDSLASDWTFISFKTDTLIPPVTPPDTNTNTEDSTSVRYHLSDHILCFPNPAHGQCTVQFTQQTPLFIQLYSIEGKLLQQIIPHTENITFSLPYPGIFILRCETTQGIFIRKIINN